jgi:hypothetical protein
MSGDGGGELVEMWVKSGRLESNDRGVFSSQWAPE